MTKRKTAAEWSEISDICAVIKGIPEGAYLVPYTDRIKAIVIESLAQEAESLMFWEPDGFGPHDQAVTYWRIEDWLRTLLPDGAK